MSYCYISSFNNKQALLPTLLPYCLLPFIGYTLVCGTAGQFRKRRSRQRDEKTPDFHSHTSLRRQNLARAIGAPERCRPPLCMSRCNNISFNPLLLTPVTCMYQDLQIFRVAASKGHLIKEPHYKLILFAKPQRRTRGSHGRHRTATKTGEEAECQPGLQPRVRRRRPRYAQQQPKQPGHARPKQMEASQTTRSLVMLGVSSPPSPVQAEPADERTYIDFVSLLKSYVNM